MRELLDGFPATLAASGTVWLAMGLTAAWLLRRRPASRSQHADAWPRVGQWLRRCLSWSSSGPTGESCPRPPSAPAATGRGCHDLPTALPKELHPVLPPLAVPHPESPARHDVACEPGSGRNAPIRRRAAAGVAVVLSGSGQSFRRSLPCDCSWTLPRVGELVRRSRPATDAVLVRALSERRDADRRGASSSSASEEQHRGLTRRCGVGAAQPPS